MSKPADCTVTPRGPLTGVLIGAFIGVLALVVFRIALRISRSTWKKAMGRAGQDAASLLLVVVSIAVIVFRFNTELLEKLPITIDVKDHIGGFVMGLLFEPLAAWLAKFAKGEPKQPAAAD